MGKLSIRLCLLLSFGLATASHAGNVYVSQCDGCTSKAAQQKILSANSIFLEQKWYSLDGIAGTVTEYVGNYFAEDPGTLVPTQRHSLLQWYYLQPTPNDGAISAISGPLLSFYKLEPVGWVKTFGPAPTTAAAQVGMPATIKAQAIKPLSDPAAQGVPTYPDSAFNVWNTIDAGSTSHNMVVKYVENSNIGKLQEVSGALRGFFGGVQSVSSNGTTVSLSPTVAVGAYVVVPFADGSKLSLSLTKDGWVTDPRFGMSTDSNGNAVPLTADQIGALGGLHVYDFRPKSWPTNPNDQASWTNRTSLLTGGQITVNPTSNGMLACTSVSGGSLVCSMFKPN